MNGPSRISTEKPLPLTGSLNCSDLLGDALQLGEGLIGVLARKQAPVEA